MGLYRLSVHIAVIQYHRNGKPSRWGWKPLGRRDLDRRRYATKAEAIAAAAEWTILVHSWREDPNPKVIIDDPAEINRGLGMRLGRSLRGTYRRKDRTSRTGWTTHPRRKGE